MLTISSWKPSGWGKRHWSRMTFEHLEKKHDSFFRKNAPLEKLLFDVKVVTYMDLCPECTKKFKKNVKVVTVPTKEDEWR